MDLGKTFTDLGLDITGGVGTLLGQPEIAVAAKAADVAADQGFNAQEKSNALAAGSPAPAAAPAGPAGLPSAGVPSNAAAGGITAPQGPSLSSGPTDNGLNPVNDETAPSGLISVGSSQIGGSPGAPADTLEGPGAAKPPIDWGKQLSDFGKNIQAMNHGGYNTIFGEAGKIGSQSAVPPVQSAIRPISMGQGAPPIGVTPSPIGMPPPVQVAPPPPIASDRRLKTNVTQSTQQLYAFLNALTRS